MSVRSATGLAGYPSRMTPPLMTTEVPGLAVDAETLGELFQARVRLSAGTEAYRQFDPTTGTWRSFTWGAIGAEMARWRAALAGEGLAPGSRIAVLLPNSVEHVCIDQAALSSGYVAVPLHVIDNPESLTYILADSGAAVLVVDSLERWTALAPFAASFPGLRRVIYVQGSQATSTADPALPLDKWLEGGGGGTVPGHAAQAITPDALAAIVYTSGTTGRPKGVMLSHRNILSNVRGLMGAVPVRADDVFLSFLPLSHTLERTVGYYLAIAAGATVVFARSVAQLSEDFGLVRPSVLVSVPRIYERAYAALREVIDSSALKRMLFALTVEIGWRRFEHAQGRARPPGALARLLWPTLDRLIGAPVRARFGGRLRAAVTGGAPMTAEIARPFLALGIPLLQGYGMTESAPVIACNRLEDNDPASVGRALSGVAVRIGDGNELLARGENVMLGYWNRPEDTARTRDAEGWLHTGDQARIEAGRIIIQGRIKDIIVTSTGEKIAPADLENALLADPTFEQVLVLGEGRPYLAALIVVSASRWRRQATELGLDASAEASLRAPAATDWALARVRDLVRGFPRYATPRAVFLSQEPWTVSAGLITPTLKPKRAAIEKRYAAEIAALYRGHA